MRATDGELEYKRDGYRVIVTGVPMSVCDGCGERYVPGPVALEISDVVAEFIAELEKLLARRDTVHMTSFEVRASERIRQLAPAYA